MHNRKYIIMMILKSLGANYPIIHSIGYGPVKPIVLITAVNEMKGIMDCVTNFAAPKIGDCNKLSDLKKALAETNSEFVLLGYSLTRKGKEQINYLISEMKLGTKLNALPLIISDSRIKREDISNFFIIYLGEGLSDIHIPLEKVVPPDGQVEVVLDKICEIVTEGRTPEEKALLAATCFLYPNLERENREEKFSEMVSHAKALYAQDDEGSCTAGLGEMFLTEIFQWQERTGFYDVHELPFLEMEVVKRIDRVILFDPEYFYMKENCLADIARSLLTIFPMEALKSALAEDGMLCPENTKAYTVKVNYYDIIGNYQRIRMLRFNRSLFDRRGELEFIELCRNEGSVAYD